MLRLFCIQLNPTRRPKKFIVSTMWVGRQKRVCVVGRAIGRNLLREKPAANGVYIRLVEVFWRQNFFSTTRTLKKPKKKTKKRTTVKCSTRHCLLLCHELLLLLTIRRLRLVTVRVRSGKTRLQLNHIQGVKIQGIVCTNP